MEGLRVFLTGHRGVTICLRPTACRETRGKVGATTRWCASHLSIPDSCCHVTQGSTAASSGTCPWEPCGATRRLVPMEWQQDSIPTWDSGYINLIQVYRGWSKLSKSPSLRQWEQAVSMETAVGPLPPGVTWLQRLPATGNAGARVSYRLGEVLFWQPNCPTNPGEATQEPALPSPLLCGSL